MIHLSGIDAVWLAAHFGWGETRGDDPIQLTSPPDVVRRVVEHLRDPASAEDAEDRKSRAAMRQYEEENRGFREICDGLLGALDDTPAQD